jgi:hypothetical protein
LNTCTEAERKEDRYVGKGWWGYKCQDDGGEAGKGGMGWVTHLDAFLHLGREDDVVGGVAGPVAGGEDLDGEVIGRDLAQADVLGLEVLQELLLVVHAHRQVVQHALHLTQQQGRESRHVQNNDASEAK